jgi:DNA-binding response OmpR family regulator
MPDVILIERDETMRRLLARLFHRHGFEVREARDRVEGLQFMRNKPAWLVVMDLVVPEYEGIQTIRHLRHYYPNTRVFAMASGLGDEVKHFLAIARELGADHTLAKPFRPEELMRILAELVAPAPLVASHDDGD